METSIIIIVELIAIVILFVKLRNASKKEENDRAIILFLDKITRGDVIGPSFDELNNTPFSCLESSEYRLTNFFSRKFFSNNVSLSKLGQYLSDLERNIDCPRLKNVIITALKRAIYNTSPTKMAIIIFKSLEKENEKTEKGLNLILKVIKEDYDSTLKNSFLLEFNKQVSPTLNEGENQEKKASIGGKALYIRNIIR